MKTFYIECVLFYFEQSSWLGEKKGTIIFDEGDLLSITYEGLTSKYNGHY